MAEADLAAIADLLPDDADKTGTRRPTISAMSASAPESSPTSTTGRPYGTWRPRAWRLSFVVRVAGEIVGIQELEGNDFLTLRTVDTSSFLIPAVRGRGYGKQMRAAVLALSLGPLHAQAAVTSAWHDNHASLDVLCGLGGSCTESRLCPHILRVGCQR